MKILRWRRPAHVSYSNESLAFSFPYVHSTLLPHRLPRRRSLVKPTTAALATGIVASVHIPTRRVNYLLVCSSHEFDGKRRHFVLRSLYPLRMTLFLPRSGKMEAVFEDVPLSVYQMPSWPLFELLREETKTSL